MFKFCSEKQKCNIFFQINLLNVKRLVINLIDIILMINLY